MLGRHWWSVGLAVLAGLVVGELLRLGPFSSQAAITALLADIAVGVLRGPDRGTVQRWLERIGEARLGGGSRCIDRRVPAGTARTRPSQYGTAGDAAE